MAVVAVIVLIAVLFLSGTVMALAVSSNLHTVDLVTAKDAVHYAAESAVARGVAAVAQTMPCPATGSINHQALATWCQTEAPTKVEAKSIQRWAIVGGRQPCVSISLPASDVKVTAWTVLAWRGPGGIEVWIDRSQQCSSPTGEARCPQHQVFANVIYIKCEQPQSLGQGNPKSFLHIAGRDAPVDLGPAIIRAAPEGSVSIMTVVGQAGIEVDEADVALPNRVALWDTVLP
jgi:hypothetical protein